jgi:hypothetical protein
MAVSWRCPGLLFKDFSNLVEADFVKAEKENSATAPAGMAERRRDIKRHWVVASPRLISRDDGTFFPIDN